MPSWNQLAVLFVALAIAGCASKNTAASSTAPVQVTPTSNAIAGEAQAPQRSSRTVVITHDFVLSAGDSGGGFGQTASDALMERPENGTGLILEARLQSDAGTPLEGLRMTLSEASGASIEETSTPQANGLYRIERLDNWPDGALRVGFGPADARILASAHVEARITYFFGLPAPQGYSAF